MLWPKPLNFENKSYRKLLLAMCCISLLPAGCRSGRGVQSVVKVQESGPLEADVDAPRQRLAGAALPPNTSENESMGSRIAGKFATFRKGQSPINTAVLKDDPAATQGVANADKQASNQPKTTANPLSDAVARQTAPAKPEPTKAVAAAETRSAPTQMSLSDSAAASTAVASKPATPKPAPPKPAASTVPVKVNEFAIQVTEESIAKAAPSKDVNADQTDVAIDELDIDVKEINSVIAESDQALAEAKLDPTTARPASADADNPIIAAANMDPSKLAKPSDQAHPKHTPGESDPALVTASLTDLDQGAATNTARRTEHPNALLKALRKQLADLPKLPEADLAYAGPAPRRINLDAPQASPSSLEQLANQISRQLAVSEDSPSTNPGDKDPSSGTTGLGMPILPTPSVARSAVPTQETSTDSDSQLAGSLNQSPVQPASLEVDTEQNSVVPAVAKVALPQTDSPDSGATKTTPSSEAFQNNTEHLELIQSLLARVAQPTENETPQQRQQRWLLTQSLQVFAGKSNEELTGFDELDPQHQLAFEHQLNALKLLMANDPSPEQLALVQEEFQLAAKHLAQASGKLKLSNLEFCQQIESYGRFIPFEGNRFAPGQQVLLYCEVDHFVAAEQDGMFETRIQGQFQIIDADNNVLVDQALPLDTQLSRNRLRDYYVGYHMTLPRQLPTGSYRLQVTLEDTVSKNKGTRVIPFEIF